MVKDTDIVVIGGVRTPMGNFGGTLKDFMSYDLGKIAIEEVLTRTKISKNEIDEVMGGTTRQAGSGPNPVRTAALKAGIGFNVPATTINNACPSSLRAAILTTHSILLGETKVGLVVGMESMSNIPHLVKGLRWKGVRMGDVVIQDGWSDSNDPFVGYGMGITAENLCKKYGITRKEQDEYALASQKKAAQAQDNGWFDEEVIPIEISQKKNNPTIIFNKDESIRRDTTLEIMSVMKPAFKADGSVTAANSCGLTDGAAAIILTTRKKANELGIKPIFRIVSYATASVENAFMGDGPSVSIPLALSKAGMTLKDMDLIEVNEAFAAQVIANERVLKWQRDKLNIHGGAIALGHPTGCSGIRIVITCYNALKRICKEYGICAICGGGGATCAIVIQAE
ncbi:MAG: putative acetyl-CoA acyltransferase [Smithella sp. PtaU1.Bin162]|nr:MAG: putative acetyl-CoA acyltransferase [Smithella sp. PtaU1.Bin162]